MNPKRSLSIVLVFIIALMALVACGGSEPVTINDIPAYPDATTLQPGQDQIADTLINNMEQDAALRTSIGVGGSIEQMAYKLPADATWDKVNSFFTEKLEADGWESGMGGPGGDLANDILASANAGNELFQTAMWSRGDQNLTVIRNADPINEGEIYLLLSLATNP